MGLAFGSISTGLPKDIVQQIVNAEKIPIAKMEERKGKFDAKKKLVEELGKLVSEVKDQVIKSKDARSLRELKVDTNTDIIGVTFDKNVAMPSSHQIEVLQLAQKSSAMSSGFEDKDKSNVGVGYIRYELPTGESKEIYIDAAHSSLNGIAKLINQEPTLGMSANVINDGTGSDAPWRLILSLNDSGNSKNAYFPDFYFIDGDQDFYLEFEREAQNAKVKVDGFEVELPDNKAKDLIAGVTVDLKKAKPGEEFALKVSEDTEAVTTKIKDLVDKINGVLTFIKQQNKLDDKTDTSKTLGGDILLQTLESRFRSTIFQDIQTSFGSRRFGDLGVSFQRDGLLKLDEKKFNSLLSENYKMVSEVLVGTFNAETKTKNPGFIDKLEVATEAALRSPDGLIEGRKRSLKTSMDDVDRRIASKQRMIEQKEKNLKDKFARLEGEMSKLRNQGAGLQGMAQMSDPVAQLG